MNPGIAYATLAYTFWGLFPLYFHQIAGVGAFEVVMHRTVWCLVSLLVVLAVQRRWGWLRVLVSSPRIVGTFALSALFLAINWLTYIWAITNAHVLDSSLGYFMLPLVNVALGFFMLQERLRKGQWLAVIVAAAGVLWLTLQAGHPPWIALVLALSFGLYGLLRKLAVLGPLEGLTLETLLLAPFAAAALLWMAWHGSNALVQGTQSNRLWLVAAGPVTAVPLLLFAAGARRIPLSTLGVLQYISPTLQLVLGIALFHEELPASRMVGFGLIWLALLIYSWEAWYNARPIAGA